MNSTFYFMRTAAPYLTHLTSIIDKRGLLCVDSFIYYVYVRANSSGSFSLRGRGSMKRTNTDTPIHIPLTAPPTYLSPTSREMQAPQTSCPICSYTVLPIFYAHRNVNGLWLSAALSLCPCPQRVKDQRKPTPPQQESRPCVQPVAHLRRDA